MTGHERIIGGQVAPTRPRPRASTHNLGLGRALEFATSGAPDQFALVGDDGSRVDYATLWDLVQRAASRLDLADVRAGDVVAVQAPNVVETVVWMWASWICGAVVCPIVTIYREHEVEFIVEQARPKAFVTMKEYRGCRHTDLAAAAAKRARVETNVIELGALRRGATKATTPPSVVDRDPDAAVLLLYTSGTTADPKGVIHSSRTLISEARSIAEIARFHNECAVFMPSPLTHVTGLLYGVVMPVLTQATSVLLSRWNPALAVEMVDRERCTLTVGATPFLRGMVDELRKRPDLRPVDVFICGGADIPSELIRDAWGMGIRAVRTYGSSEMPTATIGDPFGDHETVHLDEGYPIGKAEVRVVSADDSRSDTPLETGAIGELEVRGPELFVGYLDPSLNDAFTDDGFFRTGDLARVSDRGTVEICGRKKDLINRGGEKFSAREIEGALMEHPGIRDVAVVGVPDAVLVERACAFIVAGSNVVGMDLTVESLASFITSRGYPIQKAPEHVRLIAELPVTASGKVRKFELREDFRLTESN